MLQIQYYNKGLTKTQIEQIIKNYNLKYTTLTNEINSKLNSIIKTVLSDITPFLENIEYLSKQAKQLKEIENTKNRIESLENKLKEKSLLEKELQNNITYLKQEINELKEKEKEYERNIKAKDDIINNLEKEKDKEKINKRKKRSLDYNNSINSNKHLSNSSMDNFEINKEQKSEINGQNDEELKIQKNKNLVKNSKYMMNLKEITRNLNIYHDHTLLTRNNKNINKFISSATQKEETNYNKYNKNKKRNVCSTNKKSMKKNQDMRLSSEIKKVSKFNFNKDEEESDKENRINISQDDKSSIVFDEEIDEEIKELEIDEQNILNLINKINNFE